MSEEALDEEETEQKKYRLVDSDIKASR